MRNKSKATLPIHKQIALGQKPAKKPVVQGGLDQGTKKRK